MDDLILQASYLEQQCQQIESNLDFINREIGELEQFKESIKVLETSSENEILASLGKGIHLKTNLINKDLFVEVGSGVVVKKTPEETLNVINLQVKKLQEVRIHIALQLEQYKGAFDHLLGEIERQKRDKRK